MEIGQGTAVEPYLVIQIEFCKGFFFLLGIQGGQQHGEHGNVTSNGREWEPVL